MTRHIVNKSSRDLTILLSGDVILDVPEADHWLSGISPALKAADLAIGHLEVPHTVRGQEMRGDVPAPGAPTENVAALARAGFGMVSLAGNHIADCGPEGVADTRALLASAGVAHAGAGRDAAEAFAPAFVDRAGRTIGLLSYNCVGPETAWALPDRAGCAWLRIDTEDGGPIAPAAALSRVSPQAIERLNADVAAVRRDCDVLVVALHKGLVHTPARLAPYERAISHAAIDAGADVVAGHHAHILRGVEFYRGRPIFHGLGNGCVVTHALSPHQSHPARAEWARRRKALFGFEPDPAYTLAPFHPEAVNAILGRLVIRADGQVETGFLPVFVEPPGRPVLASGQQAHDVAAYLDRITLAAGLAPLEWTMTADGVGFS